jgi:hypothetical protein
MTIVFYQVCSFTTSPKRGGLPSPHAGYLAHKPELKHAIKLQGPVGISGEELLSILQAAITGNLARSGGDGIQVISGIATGGWTISQGIESPYYHSDSKMAHLRLIGVVDAGGKEEPGLQDVLTKATSIESAEVIVSDALRGRLAQHLSVDVEDIDASKPVSTYVVDSLTAVEIRAWGLRDVQADVSILDVVNTPSISSLSNTIVKNPRLAPGSISQE